jgi:prepilin-type N-terminal cleavage/methylation domain-containing protein
MRPPAARHFSMVEMVAALVILGILLSTYVQVVRLLGQAERTFAQESQSLIVLTNAVEQLAAQPTLTTAEVRAALERQWRATRFAGQDTLAPAVESTPAGVVLAIRRQGSNRNLVHVVIPHAPPAR